MGRKSNDPYAKLRACAYETIDEHVEDLLDEAEFPFASPIERVLFVALTLACEYGRTEINACYVSKDDEATGRILEASWAIGGLVLQFQPQLSGWRPDFLVHYYDYGFPDRKAGWAKIIVECDGHDFHERTKYQAARDRKRDRLTQFEGTPVLRFTGSEIWADPWECAMEVIGWAQKGL